MRATEKQDFAVFMTQVLAFYKQDASEFALSVWWDACKGSELEQVRKAISGHATHPERGQFPPKPADIVRELHGTFTDRSLLAWGRVSRAMSSAGAYATVDFDDPIIHATIRELGGWSAICRIDNEEQQFLQKRFCDFHRTYTVRGAPDAPLLLQGEHDSTNAAASLESPGAVKRLQNAASTIRRIA